MNGYYYFIDLLAGAFVLIMARHTYLRAKYFLHIFQQKGYKRNEYRDWLIDHYNSRVFTSEHTLFVLVIFILLALMSDSLTGSAATIILSLFGLFWFGPFNYYRGERQKKPLVFTPRVIRFCIPYSVLALVLPVLATYSAYSGFIPFTGLTLKSPALFAADIYILAFGWVVGNLLIPFLIFPSSWVTQPIENRIHRHFKTLAKEKLGKMPNLSIIAITGSYGKTSTKFMIRDLLKERYSVCATPSSYNTPMGICKVINNDLDARHQVLILEMGARYEGNIDELCDIAVPDIAVVTNVGIAHLETFGSKEAIAKTKSTLVERLVPGGTAVLNADDPLVREMKTLRNDIRVLETGLEQGTVRASDIHYDHNGTEFSVSLYGKEETFSTRLLGAHNVQNMLQAVAVATLFDIRLKTMALAASKIEPVEHRLELKQQGNLLVIDDAFNSNPTGAANAVEILSQFSGGRRIIITPGMIELGEIQDEKNREFGKAIGNAGLDLVLLVGEQQVQPIYEGIKSTGFDMEKVNIVPSLFKANEIAQNFAQKGDVVLYENDLPDTYSE